MRIWLAILICFLSSLTSFSGNDIIRVGILHHREPIAVLFAPHKGSYEVIGDGKLLYTIEEKGAVQVTNTGGKLHLKSFNRDLGTVSKVYFKRKKWGSIFKVKPTRPNRYEHQYFDNLTITPKGSKLRLINSVYIEHYVAGVIESEAGSSQNLEYYKVQAIICRTYALANKSRHRKEGFSVCDKVHC
ncbi:MAG: SpoIID/LytB domain-containing protein, partial [Flavobacteriales bacterium]|nr:SpoIID/LytB domain-containing protein [Flavobacteriales bacterium]